MSIDPLDRPHDQQPVPGQNQNPDRTPDPDFITDNPDVQRGPGNDGQPVDRPATGPDAQDPGAPDLDDPLAPDTGIPLP